jgi:hypothetical protein
LNQDPAPQGTGVTLLALYENLRQQVLAGLGSNGLGMSVFLGQGMAVWMKACSPTLTVSPNTCLAPAAALVWASGIHDEVVGILASMALGQVSRGTYEYGNN